MAGKNVPRTVPEVLEHFRPLEQEPEIVQRVRDEIPTHFFVDDPDARHYAWCSHCQQFVNLDKSRHQAEIECPYCGSTGNVIHTWRGYKNLVDKVLMYVYDKSVKSPENTITARAIYLEIHWCDENEVGGCPLPWNVEPYITVDSYYVFVHREGAVQVRPMHNWKCSAYYPQNEMTVSKSINDRFSVYAGGSYGYTPHINLYMDNDSVDAAVEGTPFHYMWDEICGCFTDRGNMGAYIRLFAMAAKYPFAVETLAKLGSPTRDWLYQLTEGGRTAGGVLNWRGKTIKKLFKHNLSKEEKKWLRSRGAIRGYVGNIFATWQWLRNQGITSITMPDIDRYQLTQAQMLKVQGIINLNRLIKYLGRQREKSPHRTVTIDTYIDYLHDCRTLGVDLTQKSNFMPRNLMEAHDNYTREILQIEELRREEERRQQSLREKRAAGERNRSYKKLRKAIMRKYTFAADGMMIYVPRKLEELVDEGIAMHNCVGTYVDRVAAGRTIVVFIRSQENPGERIGTMEISKDGTCIVQARAKYNRDLPPEAAAFVQKFREAKIDKFVGRKTA